METLCCTRVADDGLSGGCNVAREWLVAELESLGIAEIYRHEFPVLLPIDEGFWLECAGERLELFGVWPNLVRTPTLPTEGIEGPLVHGGDGSRLEGQPVAGRIVLLDYVSGTAWVDAFHLEGRGRGVLGIGRGASQGSRAKISRRAC